MGTSTEETALSIFTVLATGDAVLAADIVAPEFRNREAANGPAACSTPGPAGPLASSAWFRSAFTGLDFPILGTAVNDGQVWVRLRMQGRHTGPFVLYRDGRPDRVL